MIGVYFGINRDLIEECKGKVADFEGYLEKMAQDVLTVEEAEESFRK